MAARHIKWMLLAVIFLVAVNSVFAERERDAGGGLLIEGVLFSFMTLMWVNADARQRQYSVTRAFKIGVIFLGWIFVPVYLVRTRGWRSAATRLGVFGVQFIGISFSGGIIGTVLMRFGNS